MIRSDEEKPLKEIIESFNESSRFNKKFLKERKVFLWGVVEDGSARDVVNRLLYLEAEEPGKEITMYINSPGGVVTSGMIIYDTMRMISSPVATVCMGLAASMGSILLSAGEKGKRYIWPHGKVMIHQPSVGMIQGQASDLEIRAREIIKTKDMGARILAENCGHSVDKVMQDFDRDYWMDAKESMEYGIVDSLVEKIVF
ncbi:MAG: ClpP family protease [Candidatus Cyclobacteriaceae bacterium M3_2C_046]